MAAYRYSAGAAGYLLAAMIVTASVGTAESTKKGLDLIAQAKAATGGDAWDRIEIWHETGHVTSKDTGTIRYEHWHDTGSLSVRNVSSDSGGALLYMLFDGRDAYQSTDAEFHNRTPIDSAVVRNGAYLVAFGFFFPARFPASFHYKGQETDKGIDFEVVRVSPQGLEPVDIWLDQTTHRIYRIVSAGGRWVGRSREELSDYRAVSGVLVPFHVTTDGTSGITDTVQFELRGSVRFSP